MVALVACGGSSGPTSSSTSPIVVGASLSLSGDFSVDGQAFQRGYQLWADNVNSHGGLLGRKVKLDIVSDGSSPANATTNYQKLISLDKVSLILGPFSTLLSVAAQKVAARYGYALVEGAGGGPAAFATAYHNYFDVSLPVVGDALPFAKWITSMPASQRPTTAAYPTSNDPFTQPVVAAAQKVLEGAGIKTVYSKVFPAEVTDYRPIADQVASTNAQLVILGSVDVPTVSAFMQAWESQHYNPKAFLATGGPDQGTAFLNAVGVKNANGIFVPNAWYPGAQIPLSQQMVKAYIAKYGGNASGVNSDVAEGYSAGEVLQAAVEGTHGLNNSKIIAYLHKPGFKIQTAQGPVTFNNLGENFSQTAFAFQWQNGNFVQSVPPDTAGSVAPLYPKPNWGS
ncbi:MAG: amino acid ABC transporter substrate-binding protein [Candidatus Dormibacterales bacterium]